MRAIVFGLIFSLATISTARASSPCECEYAWSLPANETASVPLNAQLFVFWQSADSTTFSLHTQADPQQDLPVTVTAASDRDGTFWVVPQADLQAQTAYALDAERPPSGSYSLRFTTGDARDEQAPTLSGLSINGGALSGACPDHLAAIVSLSGASDDITPANQLLIRVEVTDPEAEPGLTTVFLSPGRAVLGDSRPDPCLASYPGATADKGYEATAALIDWAGNISEPSASVGFAFRENNTNAGCGCSQEGRPLTQWSLLMMAAILFLQGRRKK
jgi:hypothetical protein